MSHDEKVMTNDHDEVLIDAPLVPDPDADEEMGPTDIEAIADQDLEGSRLLLVRRAAEPIDLEGTPGGAISFACTFQPADGTRFTSALLLLRLNTPEGVRIIDVAPRDVPDQPVQFAVDRKGTLSVKPKLVEASVEAGTRKEFAVYHCAVQGSGAGTALARWNFRENPHRRDGLGREQVLVLTLPVTGPVTATVSVSARLERDGLRGRLEALRDLILGVRPEDRQYPLSFEIPQQPPRSGLSRFLRLG
jgi:hypothetical protein